MAGQYQKAPELLVQKKFLKTKTFQHINNVNVWHSIHCFRFVKIMAAAFSTSTQVIGIVSD